MVVVEVVSFIPCPYACCSSLTSHIDFCLSYSTSLQNLISCTISWHHPLLDLVPISQPLRVVTIPRHLLFSLPCACKEVYGIRSSSQRSAAHR